MASFHEKSMISAGSALLFLAINAPQTYKLTDKIFPCKLIEGNCPTNIGILIHTLVFFLVSFLTMGNVTINTFEKIKNAMYGSLIFFFLSSPTIYGITGNRCPDIGQIIMHSILYFIALVGVMYLPC